jgi:hypothetical protein
MITTTPAIRIRFRGIIIRLISIQLTASKREDSIVIKNAGPKVKLEKDQPQIIPERNSTVGY